MGKTTYCKKAAWTSRKVSLKVMPINYLDSDFCLFRPEAVNYDPADTSAFYTRVSKNASQRYIFVVSFSTEKSVWTC